MYEVKACPIQDRNLHVHVYVNVCCTVHVCNSLTPASDANVQFLLPLLNSAILQGLSQSFSVLVVEDEGLSVGAEVEPLVALATEEQEMDDDDSIFNKWEWLILV